ncbi:Endonuclease III-like protein 1 [Orchesella cincta]|uniref:Endonuclease III homolog n=1 Tax=Orchesella cincta TaxID=48709 RepID=A0A1D2MXP8_ORCCI|nr:Endonuclease III-like protein 1 [Orchesella cincta]
MRVIPPCFKVLYISSRIQTMSTRSRKRVAGNAAAASVGGIVSEDGAKKATKSRKPVKIEFEADTNAEALESVAVPSNRGEDAASVKSENTDDLKESSEILKSEEITADNSSDTATTTPTKKKKTKPVPVKVEPPSNWKTILENIRTMRSTKTAAVDTMGCERTADLTMEPKVQRFQTLVSLMLSSQTKDQVTFAAMERLKARGLTVQSMLDIEEAELGQLLTPVGFYKRKATYIKKTAEILRKTYADDIPATVDDLMSLPGVGPKMAYICMTAAWNENVGIGVDTHVHRIANRLNWTGKGGTSDPEKTRVALESWMPKDLWQEINIMLVGFGQETCLPIGPKCHSCLNKDICPASNVKAKKKAKPKNPTTP